MSPANTRVLWARHGQNAANLTRQFSYRRLDLGLTELGREQAHQLADDLTAHLQGITVSPAVAASPLRRAQLTAEIVAHRLGGTVETIEGLRELNVGDLEGRGDSQAWGSLRVSTRQLGAR